MEGKELAVVSAPALGGMRASTFPHVAGRACASAWPALDHFLPSPSPLPQSVQPPVKAKKRTMYMLKTAPVKLDNASVKKLVRVRACAHAGGHAPRGRAGL